VAKDEDEKHEEDDKDEEDWGTGQKSAPRQTVHLRTSKIHKTRRQAVGLFL
jgi:hypothetical protein